MSRYVTHRGGIVLGSANVFSCIDRPSGGLKLELPEGVEDFRDGYGSIIWPEAYDFVSHNIVNVNILTPAQQLIWKPESDIILEEWRGEQFPTERRYWTISNWLANWLEQNVGERYKDWDCRTKCKYPEDVVFFRRRKDALATIRKIQEITLLRKEKDVSDRIE